MCPDGPAGLRGVLRGDPFQKGDPAHCSHCCGRWVAQISSFGYDRGARGGVSVLCNSFGFWERVHCVRPGCGLCPLAQGSQPGGGRGTLAEHTDAGLEGVGRVKGTWQSQGARPPEGLPGSLFLGWSPAPPTPAIPFPLGFAAVLWSPTLLFESVSGRSVFFSSVSRINFQQCQLMGQPRALCLSSVPRSCSRKPGGKFS